MKFPNPTRRLSRWILTGLGLGLAVGVQADVLIGTNDERFVGTIIEQTPEAVVFESELGGRLTVPRGKIREISLTAPAPSWKPPGVGHDGFDWVQLKSGEWLRGWLQYVQDRDVEFDSDELDEMTLNLKNVRTIIPAKPMYAKFENRAPVQGQIVVSNEMVYVTGAEPVQLPRTELLGITPSGGKTGMRHWSGKFAVGLNIRSGNTDSTDMNLSGELSRRTPNTDMELEYLGNFADVNGVQSENNQRINAAYDIRLDRHWFVRPLLVEYFYDPLANIKARYTAGAGAGYYIYDEDTLTWKLLVGPGFQYTQFKNVETNQATSSSTPVALFNSYYKNEITKRLDVILSYQGMLTSQTAGLYNHHAVTEFDFEIKRHLDLEISFIWDYLLNPQQEANGNIPNKSDLRLTLGLGLRF
ncbi:MAG: DUF481 domain-containing protein [Verrucomicrobiota bacterium]